MKLKTRHFGEINIDEDKIIEFEEGLPGFPDDKQFILLENLDDVAEDGARGVFYWLQSTSDGNVAFILMDACSVMPHYNPLVNRDEIASLGEYDEEEYLIYNVVVLPDKVKNMSVNLLAPVVINPNTRRGKQVIALNDEYTVHHMVFQ